MKILLLIRSLTIGGAETQICALARGLSDLGHEVVLATLHPGGPLETELAGSGVRLSGLGKRGRWHLIGPLRALVRLIRQYNPAVVYAFLPAQTTIAALLRPFMPRHALVFGVRSADMDYAHYDWAHRLVSRLEALFARCADRVIANSRAGAASAARRGIPGGCIITIPNLIDVSRFARDESGRARIRAEWKVMAGEMLIGIVGRLDPMKDHETFLRAAALAITERPELRFVAVGSGPPPISDRLVGLAAALGLSDHMIWAGERRDMPAILSAFDIATSSSAFGEGFSNAIAEAMACAVPVVATDLGDARDLIGDTGHVVPVSDPASLTHAWFEMLTDDPTGHGARARARILARFDRSRVLREYETALLDAASRRHAPTQAAR